MVIIISGVAIVVCGLEKSVDQVLEGELTLVDIQLTDPHLHSRTTLRFPQHAVGKKLNEKLERCTEKSFWLKGH